MIGPTNLLDLLGHSQSEPAVEFALRAFAVRNRPAVEIDEEDPDGPVVETQCWVKNSRAGIEFGFIDRAAWLGHDELEFGKHPMILTEITLYGSHEGVMPFRGTLPFGLRLEEDRATIRRRMSAYESTRHSYTRDTWDTPDIRVIASYTVGRQALAFVVFSLREPPLPPLPYVLAPPPPAEELVGLLGLSLSDSAVTQLLDPLGLQDRIEDIVQGGEADMLATHGLLIAFAQPGKMTRQDLGQVLISSMTLVRERELDGREWTAPLPNGLSFEDSPETATEKLGREADERYDGVFDGVAIWHEATHSVRVRYDLIENRIMRVDFAAPGVWKS